MGKKAKIEWGCLVFFISGIFLFLGAGNSEDASKPLILQEMTWTDVKEYLSASDMVIIPIGSTEQHGPHLPLGTDSYIATDMAKMISSRAGVLVAPVVLAGYSVYHSGFSGTLSLKPETMEQVLYETAEMLIKHGFRRIMFLNGHGGNTIVQSKVIHRINHNTEAIAVALGDYARGETAPPKDWFDQHAGVGETSIMLFLEPELVHMDRAEKPKIQFTPQMRKYLMLGRKHPELMGIFWSLLATPEETGKGGASHQLSSSGVWSFSDPKLATKEIGERDIIKRVESAVNFIQTWKQVLQEKK
ncbi:MAG: creatininase family protein [Candidatus Aminicenantes bacterium]|nr:MAG: creatininase family protein [Candidatus Aminicenantes bacterium]